MIWLLLICMLFSSCQFYSEIDKPNKVTNSDYLTQEEPQMHQKSNVKKTEIDL